MSRSGYTDDDWDDDSDARHNLYRANVDRAIKGRRGQKFFRELAAAMDAMPEKVLITDELINEEGDCCTLGVVCRSRGLDVSEVDVEDPDEVGKLLRIPSMLAAEIEWWNDDDGAWKSSETPQDRWVRMRRWVESHIEKDSAVPA